MRLENGKVVMTRREYDEVLAELEDRRPHLAEYMDFVLKVLFCFYNKEESEAICLSHPVEVVDDGEVR
jgi:hypothetical protein